MQKLHGRRAVLAVGLDKIYPQASLASMPFGGPYAAKSFLQGTWRPLWPPWSPLRCVLVALGGVLEARRGVWEALGHSLGHLGVVLNASWGSSNHCSCILGAPGAVWEASWALLELSGRRLGRSWSCLGGFLGALGSILPIC